jgi:predicted transcriptional regulator
LSRKARIEKRIRVTISVSPLTVVKLQELARANNSSPALEARTAVEFYLDNLKQLADAEWQSPIERRMQKIENRLAGLMAKLVRVAAQALFFSTLPYTKGGLPNKPLPKEAFEMLWDQSRAFAANWLKKANLDEEQTEIKKAALEKPGEA